MLTRSPIATGMAFALAILLVIVVLSGGIRTLFAIGFFMSVDVAFIVYRGGWSRKVRRTRRAIQAFDENRDS
jgi:cytosine/uracil/thiamine/allantoin permease